jgi:hypothetical protein
MGKDTRVIAAMAAVLLGAAQLWAAEPESEGDLVEETGAGVSMQLSPLGSDSEAGEERLEVQVAGVSGVLRVSGVPVLADQLRKAEWEVTGSEVSGSVSNPNGGPALASFTGTVTEKGIEGTFTTLSGQSGSWVWEGPMPEAPPAPEADE